MNKLEKVSLKSVFSRINLGEAKPCSVCGLEWYGINGMCPKCIYKAEKKQKEANNTESLKIKQTKYLEAE